MRNGKQVLAATLLLYATFVTWRCPCRRLNSCHLKEYFLSVGAATAIVLQDNYG